MKKLTLIISLALITGAFSSCVKPEYNWFATLHGMIIDSTTSEPIVGANVVLSPGGKTKTTGTDGRYEFPNLDPAQYTITVQKNGYKTNFKTVTAVSGEKTEANIPLTKK